jgi:hypothetical protein
MENKTIEERLDAIEKHLNEINEILKWAEKKANEPKTFWTDGPIMMYGKHNITPDQLNDRKAK